MTNLERLSGEELIELANDGLDANDLTVELAKRYAEAKGALDERRLQIAHMKAAAQRFANGCDWDDVSRHFEYTEEELAAKRKQR